MFNIPKVANVIPVNASFTRLSLTSFSEPIDETVDFQFNIEGYITLSCSFPYCVGEGPLYWYRVDWHLSPCSAISCMSMSPTISYIAPDCPYEIIQNCIILPPVCSCEPSCIPGDCYRRDVEVWHMLATSVEHLCDRINQECCSRKPPGFMRSVKQYMRPALCCDVEVSGPGTDNYEDVDFVLCECGNLVDPCIAQIIYPCHINRCGINGPAFEGSDPISVNFTTNLLGHDPVTFAPAFDLGIMQPIELESPKKLVHRFGATIPDIIHCSHNLGECNLFKDFLKRSKIQFNEIDLYYNNEYKTWQGIKNFKEWKFIIECTPNQSEKSGSSYSFNVFVENKNLRSKLFLIVKADGFLNNKNNFEIDLNFNTKTGSLKKQVLQSKIMHDDIGVFKNTWDNELKVNMRG